MLDMDEQNFMEHVNGLSEKDVVLLSKELSLLVERTAFGDMARKEVARRKTTSHGVGLLGKSLSFGGVIVLGSIMALPSALMAGMTTLAVANLIQNFIDFKNKTAEHVFKQAEDKQEYLLTLKRRKLR